jgi:hypothetical protein
MKCQRIPLMFDKDAEKIIRKIVKEETQDLRSDTESLKKDVSVLKVDVDSIKKIQTRQGILMESMNDKVDLILENLVGNNERLKDFDKLKEQVYQNHERRIKALETSRKK